MGGESEEEEATGASIVGNDVAAEVCSIFSAVVKAKVSSRREGRNGQEYGRCSALHPELVRHLKYK